MEENFGEKHGEAEDDVDGNEEEGSTSCAVAEYCQRRVFSRNHRQRRRREKEPLITRNSSGDKIANVNFHYYDIVHALQNTIYSCINSTTYQCGYV